MRLAPTVVGENLGDIRVRRKKQQQGEKEKKNVFLKLKVSYFHRKYLKKERASILYPIL